MSDRVPFIEGREQETCDIGTLIAFLQDYPNVSNVFIVRRLAAHAVELKDDVRREANRREDWYKTAMKADDVSCELRGRVAVLEKEGRRARIAHDALAVKYDQLRGSRDENGMVIGRREDVS